MFRESSSISVIGRDRQMFMEDGVRKEVGKE